METIWQEVPLFFSPIEKFWVYELQNCCPLWWQIEEELKETCP